MFDEREIVDLLDAVRLWLAEYVGASDEAEYNRFRLLEQKLEGIYNAE